ncbi:hypothetical protein ACS0TY_025822 [Phlomoides rotata]
MPCLGDSGFRMETGRERTSEEITEDILAQVDPEALKMVMGGSEEEKSEALKESLKGKRYLIVLDDVWNRSVVEYLQSSFPDNQNGSHVVLTTRLKYLVQDVSYDSVHNFTDVRLLDKKESWDLLRQKVPKSLWIDIATKRKHKLFIDAYDQISQFLRRLDALNIRFYDFPLEVLKLVKLRYLALTCNRNLPSSISNLRKLQYLIVHPHLSIKPCRALFNLPMDIWDMKRLKHLPVTGYDLPNLGETSLQELITLLDVTAGSCTVLNRVPNLTKLGIKIELTPDVVDPLCCFDHIYHLTKLESLKCVIVNPEFKLGVVSPVSSFPCLPFSLNKLSLSGMGYPWEEMSKIASLPNLEVLKLRFNAF